MSFFNTTNETGAQLLELERITSRQELTILRFFAYQPTCRHSPSQLQEHLLPGAPLTSVRRALTNLTKAGYLAKTASKTPGPYGRPEHLWELAVPVSWARQRGQS